MLQCLEFLIEHIAYFRSLSAAVPTQNISGPSAQVSSLFLSENKAI